MKNQSMVVALSMLLSAETLGCGQAPSPVGPRVEAAGSEDAGPVDAPVADASQDPFRERLVTMATPLVDPSGVKGKAVGIVVAAITPRGRTVVGLGRPVIGAMQEPDSKTIFEIGSVSKTFVGYALALALSREEIRLEDPIDPFFPRGTPHFEGRSITVLDLATHYSGLPTFPTNMRTLPGSKNPMAGYTALDLADFLAACETSGDCKPSGLRYEYSNLGTGTLGYILTQTTTPKMSTYEALVQRDISDPLGLPDTRVNLTSEQVPRRAQGYNAGEPQPFFESGLQAGGGLRSTADDMLDFLEPALGQGPPDAVAAWKTVLESRRPMRDGKTTGFFIDIGGSNPTRYIKAGATAGFGSFIALTTSPPRAVVVLANTNGVAGLGDLADAALDEALGVQ